MHPFCFVIFSDLSCDLFKSVLLQILWSVQCLYCFIAQRYGYSYLVLFTLNVIYLQHNKPNRQADMLICSVCFNFNYSFRLFFNPLCSCQGMKTPVAPLTMHIVALQHFRFVYCPENQGKTDTQRLHRQKVVILS